MLWLSFACSSGFISAALTLNIAPQGSIAIASDTTTTSSDPFELVSSSYQSTSWPYESFPPARPPPSLQANMSALKALGLDPDKSISWETTPSGVIIGVQCNVRYGRRLDYQDCRDAYSYMPRTDERIARFAQRHSGLPHEFALPQRLLGSKGKCAISSELITPYDMASASVKNVADAAYALIERCAPRSGGIAINIGGDDHLAILLQPYAPTVRCEESVAPVPFSREACAMIEHGMEADEGERLFGNQLLDPTVEEPLPYQLLSRDAKCAIRISSSATSDTETWYHMWEATVALNAMCVRAGKRGTARNLGAVRQTADVALFPPGARKDLYMEISDHAFSFPSVGAADETAAERL